ncbi:hypothetical protein [Pseudonocardia sp. TRM90224]|uniref:hypothetical protein n=1 Tax=Pseudonocardia sp. TRM90224 TaxID=2812678 RepID=UPI001E2F05C9|nr:hypothetical protein [Pseudonocardia sp. TRM90224]
MTVPTSDRVAERPPAAVTYSLVLGSTFALSWLGFAAVRARDGRSPVTDWLDPLLAGATLGVNLLAVVALIVCWPAIAAGRTRSAVAILMVTALWTYITGELLSNTITIGEPPGDIGGLLEISSGAMTGAGLLGLVHLEFGRRRRRPRSTIAITALAATLAVATAWWFTHPIDQRESGTPVCVPGNALFNVTHGVAC